MLSIGNAHELSPNASVMLRIATLSAWAELETASTRQAYLVDVLKPYRSILAPLWISSLRDYASIRADTEGIEEASAGTLESSYTSLGKEVLLPVRILSIEMMKVYSYTVVLFGIMARDSPSRLHSYAK